MTALSDGSYAGLAAALTTLSAVLHAAQQWLSAPPDLPSLAIMDVTRRLSWALLLGVLAWRGHLGLWRVPDTARAALAMLLALLAWLPGPWGLAYWLGLAFQAPSLTTVLVALLWWRYGHTRTRRFFDARHPTYAERGKIVLGMGPLGVLVLGWVLALDTFAVWPAFIYPMGYGHGTLMAAALTGLGLLCLTSTRVLGGMILGICLIFTVTRLPSGNVWDALSDPWLWLIAHGILIRQILQKVSFR